MSFTSTWVLHFLLLLPFAALALYFSSRQNKRTLHRLADPRLLTRLIGKDQRVKRFLKSFFLLTAFGLMIFALAGPRWGGYYQEVTQKGIDIMILADVSSSMLVEDIQPNRLERGKREIRDFLKVVQGDRVGLVAFSKVALVQCPLTLDYAALQMFLNALQPDLIPVPGTDLGAAIETGLSAFDFKSVTDKVILIVTDGEDNEKRALKAAQAAAGKGVKIFIFGMGKPAGGLVPATDGKGGFKTDHKGELVLSKLQEESLREIASITAGTYMRAVTGDLDLDALYFDGIKTRTKAQILKGGKFKVHEERFTLFTLAALVILLLEDLIFEKRCALS